MSERTYLTRSWEQSQNDQLDRFCKRMNLSVVTILSQYDIMTERTYQWVEGGQNFYPRA